MIIDSSGFRAGVGIIIMNDKRELLLAKRCRQEAWQFPQGGLQANEGPLDAMYRELYEETGLSPQDVKVLGQTRRFLYYRLPSKLLRHGSVPLCIGQKQKWFLLKLIGDESHIRFDMTDKPEFEAWKWVDYWQPLKEVIKFKHKVYRLALKEFSSLAFGHEHRRNRLFGRRKTEE